jgi:hypothetical protein
MSTLRVNAITDTTGGSANLTVPGAAKAWVNFNGTGTVAIRASLNVTSITDNGVGDYTANFTTALADANYSAVYGGSDSTSNLSRQYISSSTTQFRFGTRNSNNGGAVDDSQVFIAVFR